MKVLLLRLAGPMQGWDVRQQPFIPGSRQRDIAASREDLMPTHSGVTGLLAAALGRERGQDMSDLGALRVLVRADQPGDKSAEFRMSRRLTKQGQVLPAPSLSVHLEDAIFLVGVTGNDALIEECASALLRPRWPLYLGRREFPPTLPILLGVKGGDLVDVVHVHSSLEASWHAERHPHHVPEMWEVSRRLRGERDASVPVPSPPAEPDWFAAAASAADV